jgi:(R,R)-butanediol dehydrogenase/meso-butanediol dehydrogenase/diacetyl reductase
MRVAVFRGVGSPLLIEDRAEPTPAGDELLLRVLRCGICGTDLHMTSGNAATFPSGCVLGHEFAGEVVEVGRSVTQFKVGAFVSSLASTGCGQCANCLAGIPIWCAHGTRPAMGGFSQYNTVKAFSSIELPRSISAEDGALIEPLAVALHGLEVARLRPGGNVVVLGTGAIGLATVFWARRLGAGRILCASRSRRAAELAYRMGATAFEQIAENVASSLQQVLGEPADLVFDCIGQPGSLALSIEAVRTRGSVIVLGNCMSQDALVPAQILFKEITVRGSMMYSLKNFETVARVLDTGVVEPRSMVTDVVAMDELPAAFEALRRPTYQCKTLLNPWA